MHSDTRVSNAPIPKDSSNPCVTAAFALSCSFLPRYPAISTFTPTPIQMEAAFIRVVIGNDRRDRRQRILAQLRHERTVYQVIGVLQEHGD